MNACFRVLAPKRFVGLTRFKPVAGEIRRPFSSTENKPTDGKDKAVSGTRLTRYEESYRQLENLDFMTAAKIVFSEPSKKKKFGIDFHLVQLFFALMPSLAVYLVAQYSRYEMRKMQAELDEKRKKEEEKAKELELKAAEEKEKEEASDPRLLEVKKRLNELEEALKEIVGESKRHLGSDAVEKHEIVNEKKGQSGSESSSRESTSDSEKSTRKDPIGDNSAEEKGQGRASESSSSTR